VKELRVWVVKLIFLAGALFSAERSLCQDSSVNLAASVEALLQKMATDGHRELDLEFRLFEERKKEALLEVFKARLRVLFGEAHIGQSRLGLQPKPIIFPRGDHRMEIELWERLGALERKFKELEVFEAAEPIFVRCRSERDIASFLLYLSKFIEASRLDAFSEFELLVEMARFVDWFDSFLKQYRGAERSLNNARAALAKADEVILREQRGLKEEAKSLVRKVAGARFFKEGKTLPMQEALVEGVATMMVDFTLDREATDLMVAAAEMLTLEQVGRLTEGVWAGLKREQKSRPGFQGAFPAERCRALVEEARGEATRGGNHGIPQRKLFRFGPVPPGRWGA
jgi:hypothetical protein